MIRIYFTVIVVLLSFVTGCSRQPVYGPPAIKGSDVAFDVEAIPIEKPEFFTYQHANKPISFFIMRMTDGIHSFLDACASCYTHKRGYVFREGMVTCRYCGEKFSLSKLEKGFGGCYPIKIEGKTEGSRYLIQRSLLEKVADKF